MASPRRGAIPKISSWPRWACSARRTDGALGELRQAALEPDTYQCRNDGCWLTFVQTIDRDADDVVLQFTPPTLIERWPQGADLVWQVGGFLARLKCLARAPRAA